MDLKLPDIGEGVAEGEILKWLVNAGDKVSEEQPLVEVMTDKVNVQIPSPWTGKVSRILAKEGDIVKVGQVIISIDSEGGSPAPTSAPAKTGAPQASLQQPQVSPPPQVRTGAESVLATPATRRMAREMGVDITRVRGSGPGGRITEDDVKRAAGQGAGTQATTVTVSMANASEERVPLRGLRKIVAERMSRSIHTTAQVTHVDEADMTELVALRESLKAEGERRGVKLTYLPLIVKAVIPALKEFPYVNASLDEQAGELVLKKSYNIGIATDTENGLVVPVVKDADKKDVFQIAAEIQQLAAKARAGQLTLDEVHGSTFTITNQGSVGGLFATPIINYPESAILGTHKIAKRPVVRDGRIEARDVMFLSLSFDHRILDGAYAARFVNKVMSVVQDATQLRAATQ
ncbi:MAG TPA: dihydrolipoamide acetyltransferase family protein [Nitrososphaerales archaeon]|nr:dihydrolipoamide acetyltransferase family protein [Nitrososphaerales archaeon]HUK74210.1 dihydrolipoamide acetyltransferase family protein [Nitrososphaerales archaeon]